jgi:hypothetical protein
MLSRFRRIVPIVPFVVIFDNKYKTESKIDYGKCNYDALKLIQDKPLIATIAISNSNSLDKIKRCADIQYITDPSNQLKTLDDLATFIGKISKYDEQKTKINELIIIDFFKKLISWKGNADIYNVVTLNHLQKAIEIFPSLKNNKDIQDFFECLLLENTYRYKIYFHHPVLQEYIYKNALSYCISNNDKKMYYLQYLNYEQLLELINEYIDKFTFFEILMITNNLNRNDIRPNPELDSYANYYLQKMTSQIEKNEFIKTNIAYLSIDTLFNNILDSSIFLDDYIRKKCAYKILNYSNQKYWLLDCKISYDKIKNTDGQIILICWTLLKKNKIDLLINLINIYFSSDNSQQHIYNIIEHKLTDIDEKILKIYEYIYLNYSYDEFVMFVAKTQIISSFYCKYMFINLDKTNKYALFIKDRKLKYKFLSTFE